jgi:heptose-I-phosphate ethanolaminephosphotransferase
MMKIGSEGTIRRLSGQRWKVLILYLAILTPFAIFYRSWIRGQLPDYRYAFYSLMAISMFLLFRFSLGGSLERLTKTLSSKAILLLPLFSTMFYLLAVVGLKPEYYGWGDLAFGYSAGLFFTSIILLLFLVNRYAAWSMQILLGITLSLVIATVYAYNRAFGYRIGMEEIFAIAQTNVRESIEFIWAFFHPVYGLALLFLIAAYFILLSREMVRVSGSRVVLTLLVLVILSGGAAFLGRHQVRIVNHLIYAVDSYRQQMRQYNDAREARKSRDNFVSSLPDELFPQIHVLVIGESATSRHMGIYGYFRDTTPHLEERRESLVIFEDALSPESITVSVLPKVLTAASDQDYIAFNSSKAHDLLEVAGKSGYQTYWISNQNRVGIFENMVSVIAEGANTKVWLKDRRAGSNKGKTDYDEIIIDELSRVLTDPGPFKMVILHLMGSHSKYRQRYPTEEFTAYREELGSMFFGNAVDQSRFVNPYDNSIRYTDYVLDGLIGALEEFGGSATLTYISDHGEAPALRTGHNSAKHSSYHVSVPFFIWISPEFQEQNPKKVSFIKENSAKPFNTEDVFHSILDLSMVESDVVDNKRSIFSGDYVERPRNVINSGFKYDEYDENTDSITRSRNVLKDIEGKYGEQFRKKIWAHRVNSIGALMEAKDLFQGVEFDVNYDSKKKVFSIYHEPAPVTGLILEEYLEAIRDKPEMGLWMDLKNVSRDNLGDIVRRLEYLDRIYGIRERLIVETDSGSIFEELSRLSETGFYRSYYLPTAEITRALELDSDINLRLLAGEIRTNLDLVNPDAISFDRRLMPFVQNYLINNANYRDLEMLVWDTGLLSTLPQMGNPVFLSNIHGISGLKVLLVNFPSNFDI